jgi:membrane protease YdiL (CAAX protease family)
VDREDIRTLGLWFYPGWGRELILGAGMGTGLLAATGAVLLACGAIRYGGLVGHTVTIAPALLLTVVYLLLAAAFEEIAFRGYGFQRLIDAIGRSGAMAISAGLFGVLHLFNPSVTALSTANTVAIGVLLAVGYLKTRALWLPIGLHWSWNLCMGPLLSLPVSGVQIEPMLLHAELRGPAWLGGGAYGPEGSVVLTAGAAAAIVWLLRAPRVAVSPAMQKVLQPGSSEDVPHGSVPADLDTDPPPA